MIHRDKKYSFIRLNCKKITIPWWKPESMHGGNGMFVSSIQGSRNTLIWPLTANIRTRKLLNHRYKRSWNTRKRDSPINSVGFLSMKCSQSLMNIAVVSAEGHSPWLKQWATLLLEHIGIALPPANIDGNELIPFTVKLHIFDAFFFNVVAVIKASSVCQVHKQTHFHLQSNRGKKNTIGCRFLFKMSLWTSIFTLPQTFKLFRRLDSMLGWNLFSAATWSSYLGPSIVFIGRNLPMMRKSAQITNTKENVLSHSKINETLKNNG